MDIYAEQLVAKNSGSDVTMKKAGIIIAMVVLVVALIVFFSWLFPINVALGVFVCYGGFYIMSGFGVEYEYLVTNKDLDIDKIMGKRKRKRLVSVDISTIERFGKFENVENVPDGTTLVLAGSNAGEGDYYADFKHSTLGNVRLIFTPNEKILNSINASLPRLIKLQK